MAGFSFKKQNGTDNATNLTEAKVVVYEDTSGNKYIFGVDGGNHDEFKTFQYEPSSGGAVDYSALAKEFMLGGIAGTLLGKLTTIDTNVGLVKDKTDPIPANLTARLDALDPAVTTGGLGQALKGIQDKTDPIPTNLTARLDALDPAVTTGGLGQALKGIQDKTNPIPTNLTARLDALDPTATTAGTLGEALGKLAKTTDLTPLAKTTELDPLATAASIIALGTKVTGIEDKTKLIPTDFQTRLNALNPADTNKGLGKALSELAKSTELTLLAKANQLPDDLAERLEVLNLADTNKGLGKALSELATAQRLSEINEKLTIVELDPPKGPISSEPQSNSGYTQNEDMLGKYSLDQFLG